jgi:hypothetical protein
MSKNGDLPKKLANYPDPMCTSCIYGRTTKRPWRTRAEPPSVGRQRTINKTGGCVSIDQMESPVPGFVAHIKGTPTTNRYNSATIFIVHFSDVTYVHLQMYTNAKETLEAKQAFERWCDANNVHVKHYHADNGRFAETVFMADVAKKGPTISFCGVNSHFQNGNAEQRIRLLQELARKQLLHAMNKWPVAITTNFWPYAIMNVCNSLNDTSSKNGMKTRELFAGTEVFAKSQASSPHWDTCVRTGEELGNWVTMAKMVGQILRRYLPW